MKKCIALVLILIVAISCKEEVIAKPDKLIDQKTMTNILYDMALLEAIRYQFPFVVDSNQVNTPKFIYKKYKIDSLQFVQNNMYYASHYNEYKDMFAEVDERIKAQKVIVDSLVVKQEKKDSIKSSGKDKNELKADHLLLQKEAADSLRKIVRKNRKKLPIVE